MWRGKNVTREGEEETEGRKREREKKDKRGRKEEERQWREWVREERREKGIMEQTKELKIGDTFNLNKKDPVVQSLKQVAG